jgi:preprotein translocase subunit SecG
MQFWSNLLVVLQLLSAAVMIGLVLIQHGKGADMGASFGSGASGSLFGATGSANFLSRSTAVCATIFFAATLGLSVVGSNRGAVAPSASSVFERAAAAASASTASSSAAPAPAPVAATPSAAAATASAPASGQPVIPQR